MTTHLKYVQEELCLVLEYNWEYPGVESDQDGSGPVWSPRTPPVDSDPCLPHPAPELGESATICKSFLYTIKLDFCKGQL